MSNFFVLSLGGSMVSLSQGINIDFLKKFKNLIKKRVDKGDKFIIVVGGGFNARNSISEAKKINNLLSSDSQDWIGISATHLNANIVKSIFGEMAHPVLINDPEVKIKSKKPLLFSGGYLPGNSSDFVCSVLAKTFNFKNIINISNIDYVYDKDPRKNKDAKKIKEMSWSDFLKIVGDTWTPGLNSPFDPVASKFCQKENKTVVILNGNNLSNLNSYLSSKRFKGTKIYGK